MEREAFLSRVRRAVGTTVLPDHPVDDPGLLVPDLPSVDLVDGFVAQLTAVEGVPERLGSTEQVRHRVVEIARQYELDSFMTWDDDQIPVQGIGAVLTAAGLREVGGDVDSARRLEHQAGYMTLGLGVTGAEAGFAESGTIVLRSGPGRPRMASLVPLVHVAVLSADRIHRSLAHWAADHAEAIPDATNVVFITGPSRTADIEQHINVGVHGPRYVHVLLI
ncbi:MAG: lactate utilization protein C [Acidimicrobiia bacterium]